MGPMRRNLVVARVGGSSLHPEWVEGGVDRDWDLYLVPFQPIPAQEGIDCEVSPVIPGAKWAGVREALNTWDGWREYDYVWLPDDDIRADAATIDRMFEVARELKLDLF